MKTIAPSRLWSKLAPLGAVFCLMLSGCGALPYEEPKSAADKAALTISYTGITPMPQVSVFLEPKTCSAPRTVPMENTTTKTINLSTDDISTLSIGGARLAGGWTVESCKRFAFTTKFERGGRYNLTHDTGNGRCTLRLTKIEDGVQKDVSSTMRMRQERNPALPGPRDGPYCVDQYQSS